MSSSERFEELLREAQGAKWDVILVSEKWRPNKEIWESKLGRVIMESGKFRQKVEGMRDSGVCIAAAGREENEKSSNKAVKASQEMTTSSLKEKETEITRGSSIGTPPNKKEAKLEDITNEENKRHLAAD